jgi:hypothetical protein
MSDSGCYSFLFPKLCENKDGHANNSGRNGHRSVKSTLSICQTKNKDPLINNYVYLSTTTSPEEVYDSSHVNDDVLSIAQTIDHSRAEDVTNAVSGMNAILQRISPRIYIQHHYFIFISHRITLILQVIFTKKTRKKNLHFVVVQTQYLHGITFDIITKQLSILLILT